MPNYYRQIARLKQKEVSNRLIAEALSISRNTVNKVVKQMLSTTLSFIEVEKLNDFELDKLFNTTSKSKREEDYILPDYELLTKEWARPACNELYSVLYCRTFEFIGDLNYNMDNIKRVLKKYTKLNVLILDDFLISEVNKKEAENLFKVLEYRNNTKSTIICSQLEPKEWHKNLGGSIMADSIVDRILPKAYTLILSGDSMRKTK